MRILLIIFLMVLSVKVIGGYKYLIEADDQISNVSLIDHKIGTITKLMPLKGNTFNYLFEVENEADFYLRFSSSVKIKLYSITKKLESDWKSVKEDEKIPIVSFFSDNMVKQIDMDEFKLNGFILHPIAGYEGNLRGREFFYEPDNAIFLNPESIMISWRADNPVTEIKLFRLSEMYEEIYSIHEYSDTTFKFYNLPENVRKSIKPCFDYCLQVISRSDYLGSLDNNLKFGISCIGNPKENHIFFDEQEIEINWDSKAHESVVKVFDFKNNLVYNSKTKKKTLNYSDIKDLNIVPNKAFYLNVEQGKEVISKSFIVLFNSQDYQKVK